MAGRPAGEFVHGKASGAKRHRKEGTPACDPCRAAEQQYFRDYNQRKAEGPMNTRKPRVTHEQALDQALARDGLGLAVKQTIITLLPNDGQVTLTIEVPSWLHLRERDSQLLRELTAAIETYNATR